MFGVEGMYSLNIKMRMGKIFIVQHYFLDATGLFLRPVFVMATFF